MFKKKTNNFQFFFLCFFCLFFFHCQKTSTVYLRGYKDIQKVYNEKPNERAKLFTAEIIQTKNRDKKARYLGFLRKIIIKNERVRKQRQDKKPTSKEEIETQFITSFVKTNYFKEKDFNIQNLHVNILAIPSILEKDNINFLISLLSQIKTEKDSFYHYQYLIKILFVQKRNSLIENKKINQNFINEVTKNLSTIQKVAKQKHIAVFLKNSQKLQDKDFINLLKKK